LVPSSTAAKIPSSSKQMRAKIVATSVLVGQELLRIEVVLDVN